MKHALAMVIGWSWLFSSIAVQALSLPEAPVHFAVKSRSLDATSKDLELLLDVGIEFRLKPRQVSGSWGGRTVVAFLNDLATSLDADWYFDGTHIHFVPVAEREEIELEFRTALQTESFARLLRENAWPGSGLVADSDGSGKILVRGPQWWMARARMMERWFDTEHTRLISIDADSISGVMMFGLRHAWADSKTLKFADKEIKVPGVVQLLREVINDKVAAPPAASADGAAGEAFTPSDFVEITADLRLNAVVIRDDIANFNYYHSIISGLDTPADMVMLDAYIIDISKNKIKEFGIDWQVAEGDVVGGFGIVGAPREQNININFGTGSMLASVLSDSGVLTRAKFLQTTGDSTIISVPSVLTLDNQEAIFSTTETFYARVTGVEVAQLVPVQAETELRVTPHILTDIDGRAAVQLLVSIKDGNIDDSAQSLVDELPRVVTHYLTTQAIVSQGESLVVGGQVVNRSVESVTRVPVLSWIPIVGLLFQNRRDESREYVRLFVIHPRFASEL